MCEMEEHIRLIWGPCGLDLFCVNSKRLIWNK